MDEDTADRQREWFGYLLPIIGGVGLCVLVCGGTLFYVFVPPSPQRVFKRETGLTWPSAAVIVTSGDDHGGFMGEGEFHLVFDVDAAALKEFLKTTPRPPLSNWTQGPVPTEIGYHCNFGTGGVSAMSKNGGPRLYADDAGLEDVLSASEIVYSAHERCCDTNRWHNGTLLIVDPRTGRVWLSIWDF